MPDGQHDDSLEPAADPGSQLRRPRTGWSLGMKERRARQAVEQALKPAPSNALALAQEQLAHVREAVGEKARAPVIDLAKLGRSDSSQAPILRMFADDIISRRRASAAHDVVVFREEDVTMLAELLSCPAEEVTPLLERLGVLAH